MKNILITVFIVLAFMVTSLTITNGPIQAAVSDTEISKKLDDILKSQKEILGALASIKEELDIVKIRVTR